MKVLFTAPQVEYDMIKEQWLTAIQDFARRGVFVGGPAVSRFEAVFASYCQAEGALG